jgi:YVTN family beta-propeller protein
MKSVSAALALACLLGSSAALPAAAQTSATGSLLVLSKRDHNLAVVDSAILVVKYKVPVGDDPHEVIASTDGRWAWVTNYGSGAFHSLAMIDLAKGKALPSIDTGALTGPHGITFADGKPWFTAEGAKAIGRYDPVTHKVDLILGTGQNRTHMLFVSPNGKHIITTNVNSGTVSLMDLELMKNEGPPPPPPGLNAPPAPPATAKIDWNESVIKVGPGSEGFDITPDGHEVWVANAGDGTISVIDWVQRKVTATIAADAKGGNRLKFTLDGNFALVSAGSDVVVINVASRKVIKRIPVGKGGGGILMEPGGGRAFVACGAADFVYVIDLASMTVTGHFSVGGEPDGMAWAAPIAKK